MRIFLIDDDQLSIFLAKNVLALEDVAYDIETFSSAQDALEVLKTGGEASLPELIFLDLNMPLMDGWDFLDALTPLQSRFCERCSIYVLTSSLDVADTTRLKDYPFVSGLIHKPLKSEDIHFFASCSL